MHHAGKFTCSPSYAKPDTVTLHVIDGKKIIIKQRSINENLTQYTKRNKKLNVVTYFSFMVMPICV